MPSCKVVTILLTIFPLLYFSSLWLIYFITGSLYLLSPFIYFKFNIISHKRWRNKIWACFILSFFPQKSREVQNLLNFYNNNYFLQWEREKSQKRNMFINVSLNTIHKGIFTLFKPLKLSKYLLVLWPMVEREHQ